MLSITHCFRLIFFLVVAITRKRLAEEKKLNQGLERFTNLQKQHVHHKEEVQCVCAGYRVCALDKKYVCGIQYV